MTSKHIIPCFQFITAIMYIEEAKNLLHSYKLNEKTPTNWHICEQFTVEYLHTSRTNLNCVEVVICELRTPSSSVSWMICQLLPISRTHLDPICIPMAHRWLSACLGKGETRQGICLGFRKSATLVLCTDYLVTRAYYQLCTTRLTMQCLRAEPPYVVNCTYLRLQLLFKPLWQFNWPVDEKACGAISGLVWHYCSRRSVCVFSTTMMLGKGGWGDSVAGTYHLSAVRPLTQEVWGYRRVVFQSYVI